MNCSFGKPAEDPTPADEIAAYKMAMVNYPGLIVCSAANNSVNSDQITIVPAGVDLDNIISVGNTYTNYHLYDDSNYGVASVDIAAPGHETYTISSTGTYEWFYGTSAAAPYVAGTAALILSICPDMSTEQLKEIILDTASTESALIGKVANGAFLDAGAAVEKAANMVKVTFNDNNGNTEVVYYEKGTIYGDLPVPEREGCTFNAWYNGSTLVTEDTVVTEGNKWFYANWKATITYDTNGGVAIPAQEVTFGQSKSLTPTSTTRTGCTLYGWKVNGETYTGSINITGNTTLSAIWQATVTYDTNGGSSITSDTVEFEESYPYEISENKVPNRGQLNFYGWCLNDNINKNSTFYNSGNTIDITGNITLHAGWEATVAVNSETGYREYTEKIVFADSYTFALDDIFTKTGYKQIGWKCNDIIYDIGHVLTGIESSINVTAQWEELFYVLSYDAPLSQLSGVDYFWHYDNLDGASGIDYSLLRKSSVAGNYYLWRWEENGTEILIDPSAVGSLPIGSYQFTEVAFERPLGTVTFDANGGENAPGGQTVYYESGTILTTSEPTREGYTFFGWSTSPNGSAEYLPGDRYYVAYTSTLYAVWVENDYVVRFDTGTDVDDDVQVSDPPASFIYDGSSYSFTMPDALEREGNVFGGWNYTCEGVTTVYYPGQTIDLADFVTEYDPNGGNTIRFTAVWQSSRTEYAIAFVDIPRYDGVTGDTYVRVVEAGKNYGDCYICGDEDKLSAFPADPVTDGYIFDGWADAEGNIITADTVVEKDGFHYIYARWIPEESFTDVADNSYYADAVSMTSWYGYMGGTGNGIFDPSGLVDRGTASVVLRRLEGSPVHGNNVFYDVDTYNADGSYNEMSMAITWMSENGIASAVSTNYFGATTDITREQLAVILYRYAQYKDVDMTEGVDDTVLSAYTDASDISSWATDAVKWAVSLGLMSGISANEFDHDGGVTRAQLAVVTMRIRNLFIDRGVITALKSATVNAAADSIGYLEPVLGDNSWAQINAASEAGVADVIWSVGDTKAITLSTGEQVTMQIYGFNHDDVTGGGKAGITFGLTDVLNNVRRMNETVENGISFTDTFLYDLLNGTIYDSLPADLRSYMKSVDKTTSIGDGSTDLKTESMDIFLFSEVECYGNTTYSVPGEGSQYEIFDCDTVEESAAVRASILKGNILEWWLRSPKATGSASFCLVHSSGNAGHTSASWPYAGVNFGLCI